MSHLGGSGLYVAEFIAADSLTETITFDDIPGALSGLELSWSACTAGAGDDYSVLVARFNDDLDDPEHDYFWNIAIPPTAWDPDALNDNTYTDEWGGLGFIGRFAVKNQYATGSARFPDHSNDAGGSISYDGYGQVAGGAYTPTVWALGGWRQGFGPLAKIDIRTYALADTTTTTPLPFQQDTRFTLLGFPEAS